MKTNVLYLQYDYKPNDTKKKSEWLRAAFIGGKVPITLRERSKKETLRDNWTPNKKKEKKRDTNTTIEIIKPDINGQSNTDKQQQKNE